MTPELRSAIEHTPLVLAEPEEPFWGFGEVLTMAATFLITLALVAGGFSGLLKDQARLGYWQVIEESLAYAVLFLALKLLFFWAEKPLFRSLGWIPVAFGVQEMLLLGILLSAASSVLLLLLHTPEVHTPFEKMLNNDLASRIVITVFGITLGPVVEELLFRGFLQPVLVNAAGTFPGILITSCFFGAMHLSQNAGMWQSGLVITLAGFAFGLMRHVLGSTRASTILHIGYNSLPFALTLLQGLAQGADPIHK